jgi:outer membrane receptor protein involved in Fe transport
MSNTTLPPLRLLRADRGTCLAGLALLFLTLCLMPAALAQTGTIAGVVVDSETGETLIGVNVIVEDEFGTGAATGLDGDFRIPGVAPGTYSVAFSYLGYQQQRVTGVEVASGETTTLDIALAEEALELEGGGEVVIEAEALLNNEAGLLRERQRATAVSDAISAETISKSGSSDAADAMERVTGASVVGGKYVYVRGLGDRYANTQLNGASLPTADPDRRAVQFDLFPSNLLENIVTLKTFTADRPGNFSGGLVDISTKSFPEDFDLRISASTGFDSQAQFNDNFLTYAGGDTDWLAIDDGARSLPSVFEDQTVQIPNNISARTNDSLATRLTELSRAFDTDMALERARTPINQSYAASLGNQHGIGSGALGYVLSLNYNRSSSFYEDGRTERYEVTTLDDDNNPILAPELLLDDTRGTEEVSWGGIGNVTYRVNPRHEVGLNSLYSRSGESQARLLAGRFPLQFDDDRRLFVDRALLYVERDLYSFQLRGRHQFPGLLGAQLEWMGTLSETELDEPDQRFFSNVRTELNDGSFIYGLQTVGAGGQQRFFRNTTEGLRGTQADVTVPFDLFGRAAQVKVGGRYERTDRDAFERRFDIRNDNAEFNGGEDGLGDVDGFLDQLGVIDTTASGRYIIGGYVTENRNNPFVLGNNYDGELEVGAGYLQAEISPLERLRVIVGARFETTRQSITTQQVDSTTVAGDTLFAGGRIDADDVLPSLNVVYALTDNMNVRAAATRTLARPTFLEFSPGGRLDFALGDLVTGNPQLDRSLITNLDLRWEWFNAPGAILAASGYYKNIADPIERVIANSNGSQSFRNVESADIYGIELELRQRLSRALPSLERTPVLRNLALGLNTSFVQSSIAIDSTELALRRAINPDADDTRALQGQSPFLVNADLTYENFESGTNVGLYFNVFGRRLSQVSGFNIPDIYEEPSPQLDFIASQELFGAWTVKLSAKNLLGASFREVYDADFAGGTPVYQEYDRATSFSIGISYSPRFGGGPPAVPATPSDIAGPLGG